MTNRDLEPIGEFDLGPDITSEAFLSALSSDGAALIMAGGTRPLPVIVDVDSATMAGAEPPPEADRLLAIRSLEPGEVPGSVSATYILRDEERSRITWAGDGSLLREEPLAPDGEPDEGIVSPDGNWRLIASTLRDRSWGIGDQENWVYTELQTAEPRRPALRVLSGWSEFGLGLQRRWLADSSGFVVEAGDDAAPLDDYTAWRTNRAHYVVATDGQVDKLPPLPRELSGSADDAASNWGYYAYFGGPEPSPGDTALLVYGRRAVYNRLTGEWFGPGAGPAPDDSIDPWRHGSHEAYFAFPNLGRDYASPGTILPPLVERAPFRDEVTLTVARAGDCLNLRDRPGRDAEILDCMVDGAGLTVADPQYLVEQGWRFEDGPPAFWSDDATPPHQMYVYVEAGGGRRGWAAIQYLDWAPGSAT
jgi:hypothetical protein